MARSAPPSSLALPRPGRPGTTLARKEKVGASPSHSYPSTILPVSSPPPPLIASRFFAASLPSLSFP